ncbi:MAG: zinc ribbon domain-containing protein [Bacilli bacterium]
MRKELFHLEDNLKKYKDLKEREYRCNVCNNKEDRDINASIKVIYERNT